MLVTLGVKEAPPEKSLLDELHDSMSMSPKQRLTLFTMCVAMGLACLAVAMALVPTIVLFPAKFAFFVTMGNMFLMLSTGVLFGFRKQLTSMAEAHRWQAAVLYALSMGFTMVSAVQWQSYFLSIVFTGVQVACFLWYTLSYIPYARMFVSTCWSMVWAVLGPIVGALGGACVGCLGMFCKSAGRSVMRVGVV